MAADIRTGHVKLPNIIRVGVDNLNVEGATRRGDAKLILKPEAAFICQTSAIQFQAFLVYPYGEVKVVNGLSFRSSNPQILSVDPLNGTALAYGEGVAAVSVKWQGQIATASVTIVGAASNCCSTIPVGYQILIDNSSSMAEPFNSGAGVQTKLDIAKYLAQAFCAQINLTKDFAGLWSFNTYALSETPVGQTAITAESIALVQQTEANTNFWEALLGLVANAPVALQQVAVIFTDGESNPRISSLEKTMLVDLLRQFKGTNGVVIVVGIRARGSVEFGGFNMLEEIASAGYFINLCPTIDGAVEDAKTAMLNLMGYFCGFGTPPEALPAQVSDVEAFNSKFDENFGFAPKFIGRQQVCLTCPTGSVNVGYVSDYMTDYNKPENTVLASSEGIQTPAWAGFSRKGSWSTALGTTTGWLRYGFDIATIVHGYEITALLNSMGTVEADSPYTWTFEASNDGGTWTTLDTQTAVIFAPGQMLRFEFANTTAYLFYRLNISAANPAGITSVGLQLFRLLGVFPDPVCNVAVASSDITQEDADQQALLKAQTGAQANISCLKTRLPAVTFFPPNGTDATNGLSVTMSVAGHPLARIRFTTSMTAEPPIPMFGVQPSATSGIDYRDTNAPYRIPPTVNAVVRLRAIAEEPGFLASVSSEVSYTTTSTLSPPVLSVSTQTFEIDLSWAAVQGASSYVIYRSTVSGGPYTQIGAVSGLTFADTTAFAGVQYYYVITADNPATVSPYSNEVNATIAVIRDVWLKSDTGVYHDQGVTLATDGQTVAQWNDASGQGNNMTFAFPSNSLALHVNQLNGYPCVRFNAGAILAGNFRDDYPITYIAVVKFTAAGDCALISHEGTPNVQIGRRGSDGALTLWNNGTVTAAVGAMSLNQYYVVAAVIASDGYVKLNGVSVGGGIGQSNLGMLLGSNSGGPINSTGFDLVEAYRYNGEVAIPNVDAAVAALKTKYGL